MYYNNAGQISIRFSIDSSGREAYNRPMNTFLTFIVASLLAVAQDPIGDLLKEVKIGDRIEIALRNEGSVCGLVKAITPQEIKIDLSREPGGLNALLILNTEEIESFKKLKSLDSGDLRSAEAKSQAERERLAEANRQLEEEMAKLEEEDIRKAVEADEGFEEGEKKGKVSEAIEKAKKRAQGLELLEKFPPDAGWGEEKLAVLRTQFIRTKVPITEDEREFVKNFDLWKEAKTILEKELGAPLTTPKKSEEGEPAPEEPKAPETAPEVPTPEPKPEEPSPEPES
ncbi:MAG: hypothetical protein A2Z34_11650 [Planctomycetes bacterium RBG_16_59_8]|nr:MAG: hypothetical protein A2Z34_11650 [Planctomycetes bacterium RBG_16_59_8]